jgi:hypothetical protein
MHLARNIYISNSLSLNIYISLLIHVSSLAHSRRFHSRRFCRLSLSPFLPPLLSLLSSPRHKVKKLDAKPAKLAFTWVNLYRYAAAASATFACTSLASRVGTFFSSQYFTVAN